MLSGHSKSNMAAKKHKLCTGKEFEGLSRKRQRTSISWGMESSETDARDAIKKFNLQVSMPPNVFGYHFEGPVSECQSKMADPRKGKTDRLQNGHNIQVQHHNWISRCKPEIMEQSDSCHMKGIPDIQGHIRDGQNALLQIHDGVERTFKTAQRRSRKGTPCRRLRDDSIKCNLADQEKNGSVSINRESRNPMPKNSFIYSAMNRDCMPIHSKAHVQEDIQHPPRNFDKNEMINEDHDMYIYGKRLLNQEFIPVNEIKKERNEQRRASLGGLIANQIIKKGGMKFTDPRIGSDATRRSKLPVDREQCKQARTAAFMMEHNMADQQRGRGIPLYSPWRDKTMTSDELLWHHKVGDCST